MPPDTRTHTYTTQNESYRRNATFFVVVAYLGSAGGERPRRSQASGASHQAPADSVSEWNFMTDTHTRLPHFTRLLFVTAATEYECAHAHADERLRFTTERV